MEHWLPRATPSVARSKWAPLKQSKEAGFAELSELENKLKEEVSRVCGLKTFGLAGSPYSGLPGALSGRSGKVGKKSLTYLWELHGGQLDAIRVVEAPPPIRFDPGRHSQPRPSTPSPYRLEPTVRRGDALLVTRSLSSLRLGDIFSADGSASSDNSSEYAEGLPLVNVITAEHVAGRVDVMDDDDADTSWEL